MIDDVDGRVVYANKVFLELFGLQPTTSTTSYWRTTSRPNGAKTPRPSRRTVRGELVPPSSSTREPEDRGADVAAGLRARGLRRRRQAVRTQSAIIDITRTSELSRHYGRPTACSRRLKDAIVVMDPKTREILDLNAAAAKLYGRPWASWSPDQQRGSSKRPQRVSRLSTAPWMKNALNLSRRSRRCERG